MSSLPHSAPKATMPSADSRKYPPQLTRSMMETLHGFQQTDYLCDVVLLAEDGLVKAHSAVLAAASPVFRAALLQKASPVEHVIVFPEVDVQIIDIVVQLVYTGCLSVPKNYREAVNLSRVMAAVKSLGLKVPVVSRPVDGSAVDVNKLPTSYAPISVNEQQCLFAILPAKHDSTMKRLPLNRLMDSGSSKTTESYTSACAGIDALTTADVKPSSSDSKQAASTGVAENSLESDAESLLHLDSFWNRDLSFEQLCQDIVFGGPEHELLPELHLKQNSVLLQTDANEILGSDHNKLQLDRVKSEALCEESDPEQDVKPSVVTDTSLALGDGAKFNETTVRGDGAPNTADGAHVKSRTKRFRPSQLDIKLSLSAGGSDHLDFDCSNFSNTVILVRDRTRAKPPRSKTGRLDSRVTKSTSLLCEQCGQNFRRRHLLNRHQRLHSGIEPFRCSTCQRAFANAQCLERHKIVHTGERPYLCQCCGSSFAQLTTLLGHIGSFHPETADTDFKTSPFRCNLCQMAFLTRLLLIQHQSAFHRSADSAATKPRSTCTRSYVRRRCLPALQPVTCEECSRKFVSRAALIVHSRVHSDSKQLRCKECSIVFKTQSTLYQHVLQHTKELPFECHVCKRRFRQPKTMLDHLRLHTQERPFSCDLCSRMFRYRSNLVDHKLTHSRAKPHGCSMCQSAFRNKADLRFHCLRVHGFHLPRRRQIVVTNGRVQLENIPPIQ